MISLPPLRPPVVAGAEFTKLDFGEGGKAGCDGRGRQEKGGKGEGAEHGRERVVRENLEERAVPVCGA